MIIDVNNELLHIIANTSPALIDGPPNVAREIAMVDGAMYDAVNAASGGTGSTPYQFYSGGAVANASAQAAALSAAYTVMTALYGTGSLYQQLAGVTAATYSATVAATPSLAAILPANLSSFTSAGTIVGPTTTQYTAITNDLAAIGAELASIAASANTAAAGSGTNGTNLGTTAGNAMIAGRASDNSQAAMISSLTNTAPTTVVTPGVYVAPSSRPPLEPAAGSVTPFIATPAQQTAAIGAVPNPPAVSSSAYANILLRTECQGSSGVLPANVISACQAAGWAPQTAAQAQAALYWNDPGGTYQPPGHWLAIADAAASSTSLGLLQHAQVDALVGAAMSDAGAAAWQVKFNGNGDGFNGNLWRPITAIQDCANWNATFTAANACDPTWSSLIATPPHPDYLAGHPAFSGAAAAVLDNFFQTDNVPVAVADQAYCNGGTATRDATGAVTACTLNSITYSISNPSDCNNAATGAEAPLNPDFTVNPLYNASPLICAATIAFTGFQDASSGDLGSTFSRVVGGIHSSIAVTNALALGNQIGQAVANDANIPEPGTLALLTVGFAGIGMLRRRGTLRLAGLGGYRVGPHPSRSGTGTA